MKTNFTYTAYKSLYLQSILVVFAFFLLTMGGGNSLRAEEFEGFEKEGKGLRGSGFLVLKEDGVFAAPVAENATVSLAENSANETLVHTVVASDADQDDVLAYNITAGNEAEAFAIDPSTGAITVADASQLDYENPTQFVLAVNVTDGIASDDATITINISDVDEAPVVSIISPQAGDPFTAPADITITADASDPDAGGSVVKVEFYKGTEKLGEDLNGGDGWSYFWQGVAGGNYSLTVKATDINNLSTISEAVEISVSGANSSPAVSISSPAEGAEFTTSEDILIEANASDTDGSVAKVEFFAGTVKLGEDTDGADGWSFNWTDAAGGSYKLTAIATDNSGAPTTSAEVNITVSGANNSPAVSISSPAEGAVFNAGDAILITANASDTDGSVAKVEFFAGTVKLGEDTDGADGWSFNWTDAAGGSYKLTAIATDNSGAPTTSAGVNITVSGSNTPPAVSITSPAEGASFTASENITINANASDPDADGSVVKVEFFEGDTKLGEDFDGTNGWSYNWLNVAAGIYALTAIATDDQGARTTSASVNITVLGTPINLQPESTCGSGTVTLSADPGSGGDAVRWYDASTGGAILATTSLGESYTTEIISSTTSYWISTYNTSTFDESDRVEIVATVKPVPGAPTVEAQTFCSSENPTVADLPQNEGSYTWYGAIDATTALPSTDPLTTDTYYVTTTSANGCESDKTAVSVDVNTTPDAPTADAAQSFCSADNPTVSDLAATGSNLQWYLSTTATEALDPATALISQTYYVSQTVEGCKSIRTAVSVDVNTTPDAPVAMAEQTFCSGENPTVGSLPQGDGSYKWYSSLESTTELEPTQSLAIGTYSYFVSTTVDGCESGRTEVSIQVKETPSAPTVAAQEFCSEENPTVASLPQGEGSYTWYADNTLTAKALSATDPLTTRTYYATTTAANGCESEKTPVSITVHPQPDKPSITNIKSSYYSSEPAVQFTGSPSGGAFTIDGNSFNGYFDPCSKDPGTYTIRYTFTDENGCSNFREYEVTVIQSVYTVVIDADPFPICKGQQTKYTAYVYRDAQVIYPYLEDPALITQENPATTYNPAYDPYLPSGWKEIHKLYPARFFKPVVVSGTLMPAGDFEYQWTKNESQNIGPGRQIFSQAGLSSTDYYKVYVTEKKPVPCVATIIKQLTNPMFISEPDGYTINLSLQPSPICTGDDVTFTATLGSQFEWDLANLKMSWKLRRSGTVYNIKNASGTSDLQLSSAEIQAALTSLNVTPAELITGDEIFVEFITDLESALPSDSKCKTEKTSVSPLKITINEPVAFENQVLDEEVVCSGAAASFSPNPVPTGTNLQYQWYHNGTPVGNNSATYSITSVQKADEGTYSLGVTNLCTTTEIKRDIGTLTVKDLAVFSISGIEEYCELYPESYPISLSDSESGVNYTLILTTEEGVTEVVETLAGTGEKLTFTDDQSAEGIYTVKAEFADDPPCSKDMNGTFTINVTESTSATGELEIWWVEDEGGDMWEVTAITNHSSLLPPGANPTYEWYKYDEASGAWMEPAFAITTVDSILVEPETTVKAVVKSPESTCVEDLILDFNPAALPVEIFGLKAEQQDGQVILSWSTASEKDNTGFEVQVSADAKNYKTIAFVETKNGDSNAIQEYRFVDRESGMQGSLYYRLKQIDIDGTVTFYGPVYIEVKSQDVVSFYPNPFEDELIAEIKAEREGEVFITITNTLGASLLQKTVQVKEGVNTEQLLLDPSWQSGVYFVFIRMNGVSKQYKLMRQ